MSIWNIFGNKSSNNKEELNIISPDNKKLIEQLSDYNKNPSNIKYEDIICELIDGNSFLFLPSINDDSPEKEWKIAKKEANLTLGSLFDIDGLKVLGAFTSEESLLNWVNEESDFVAMPTKDVLELCKSNGIERIVIDSDQSTMFVLEKFGINPESKTLQEDTLILTGAPNKPIAGSLLGKLKNNFKKLDMIEEAFQYVMVENDKSNLMIGFKLNAYSYNSKNACINAINESIENEEFDLPLNVFFLEDNDWYKTVKEIDNSLIFRKN